jgi:transcriptional regulator GlxA family with amidase domain
MSETFSFLLLKGFSHLAFSCAVEPLRLANLVSGKELYRIHLASEDGLPASCLQGFSLAVHSNFASLPKSARVFVLASVSLREGLTRSLRSALRNEKARGARIGGLCSGAWILAEMGFLNGRPAALHWEYHDSFRETFPEVELLRGVFSGGDPHMSAAGGAATADLMLHLIGQAHGQELAISVADQMVYSSVRSATVEQCVSLQSRNGVRNAHLVHAVDIMRANVEEPPSPAEIAGEIGISARQMQRLFKKHLQSSPRKFQMELRLERARKLLLQTEASITEVAIACGFTSPGHFSKVYRTKYGMTPQFHRARFG